MNSSPDPIENAFDRIRQPHWSSPEHGHRLEHQLLQAWDRQAGATPRKILHAALCLAVLGAVSTAWWVFGRAPLPNQPQLYQQTWASANSLSDPVIPASVTPAPKLNALLNALASYQPLTSWFNDQGQYQEVFVLPDAYSDESMLYMTTTENAGSSVQFLGAASLPPSSIDESGLCVEIQDDGCPTLKYDNGQGEVFDLIS